MIFVLASVCFFGLLFALIGYIFQISDWKCPVHYIPPQFLRLWTTHGGMCVNFASCKMPRMIDIYFPTSQLDRNISLWCQTVFTSPPKCVSLSGISSSLYSLTRLTRHRLYVISTVCLDLLSPGDLWPWRTVSLLSSQWQMAGAGLDSDWTLALRTGNGHEVFAHFTADRNTHTHRPTRKQPNWSGEVFARESAGSSILRFCRRSEAARSVES